MKKLYILIPIILFCICSAFSQGNFDSYMREAQNGDAASQYFVGSCYLDGLGVPQDYNEAVAWLMKAAKQGYLGAQYKLANCYYNGTSVTKDYNQAVYWYRKAAEQGNADAQCRLGNRYYYGEGVTKDYSQAVYWYQKAAEQGNANAQYNLGGCYYYGEGVTKDYNQAVYWYRKAAEQGNADAQCNLGNRYYYGEGVTKDYNQAVYWYRKAAEQGNAYAQCNLGNCYYYGGGVTKDYNQAVYWYRKAAEQRNADAQCNLGNRYYFGEGVTKDYNQAVYWYRKAAEQGNADAQCNLGNRYYYGEGVTKDYSQAVYWYQKAAERGNADAQCNLGNRYYNGEGVTKDYSQAVYWYQKAAEQGNANAQNNLGNRYYYGEGVAKDYNQAVYWYRKAAEQGNAYAQCNLGNCYYLTKDYNQAVYWWRKAAEQGNANAQYNLGESYEEGKYVNQDFAVAMEWYKKAADNGNNEAKEKYENLAAIIAKKEVEKMQPPLLTILDGSLLFSDATGDNRIDPNEQSTIGFKILNKGKGTAKNCEVRVLLSGAGNGITITKNIPLPEIAAGQSHEVSIPLTSDYNTQDGKALFSIEVYEPNGWGIQPFNLSIATKAYEPPFLQVVDYNCVSSSGKIQKVVPFTLTLNLQNTKYGDAEDVKVDIKLPLGVFLMDGNSNLEYPLIKSGEVKPIKLVLAANNNYNQTTIPVSVDIKEKHGKYAENKHIDIALNQATSSTIDITPVKVTDNPQRPTIKLAKLHSDVDVNIPQTNSMNENSLVLIVANEHYQSMPTVPYAISDGNTFKEYCVKTLGIPQENILYQTDATLNVIRQKIDLLHKKTNARAKAKKETNIIFYYTGHGMPDVNTQRAYLMPVDGYDENIATGYKMDDLYLQLGQMPANTITVFLDACFSGVNRNDQALSVHKGARLVARSGSPVGNMVVFAASQGNQTASVNDNEKHGLFTYFLLKKLQSTEGNVSLKELADYLTAEVNIKSLDIFEKEQIPSIVASPIVESQWQNWKLK